MGSNLLERARSDLYTINANQHKEKTDLKDSTSSPDKIKNGARVLNTMDIEETPPPTRKEG